MFKLFTRTCWRVNVREVHSTATLLVFMIKKNYILIVVKISHFVWDTLSYKTQQGLKSYVIYIYKHKTEWPKVVCNVFD